MPFDHETVNHSISEYVRDQASHTHEDAKVLHGSMLGRGYQGMPFDHDDRQSPQRPLRHGIGAAQRPRGRVLTRCSKRGYHGTYHHMSAKHLGNR